MNPLRKWQKKKKKKRKKRTGCEAGDLTLTLELLTASWSRNLSSSA